MKASFLLHLINWKIACRISKSAPVKNQMKKHILQFAFSLLYFTISMSVKALFWKARYFILCFGGPKFLDNGILHALLVFSVHLF